MKVYLVTIENRMQPVFDFCPKMFLNREEALKWAEESKDEFKIKIYEYVLGDVCETEVNTVDFDDSPLFSM